MARPRDFAAEYRRRQENARRLGFGSYYERRVAGVPRGERAGVRGHRGKADFLASLREGDLILCDIGSVRFDAARGRYGPIWKTVIPASGGREREFVLRNQTRTSLLATVEKEVRRGVIFSPSPSLDQRRLLSENESEGGY